LTFELGFLEELPDEHEIILKGTTDTAAAAAALPKNLRRVCIDLVILLFIDWYY
jgi:hypothetical protein